MKISRLRTGERIVVHQVEETPPAPVESHAAELVQLAEASTPTEPQVRPALIERMLAAFAAHREAAERVSEARSVVERVSGFLARRSVQRSELRRAQKAGARAAAIAGNLDAYVAEDLQRLRIEVGRDYMLPAADDIEVLSELITTEKAGLGALLLAQAEAAADAIEALCAAAMDCVEQERQEIALSLLPIWQRAGTDAVRLDMSKDHMSVVSRWCTAARAEALQLRDRCRIARATATAGMVDMSWWTTEDVLDYLQEQFINFFGKKGG